MNLKRIKLCQYAFGLIIIIIISNNVLSYSTSTYYDNPRSYYDVKIIMISRMYDSINIDGFHSLNEGLGYDDEIILQDSNKIRLFGLFIVYNETTTFENNKAGGWIHSKIEIFNYNGWMIGQNENQHLIMIGDCEIVKITSYR
jgi:hypothetical protein